MKSLTIAPLSYKFFDDEVNNDADHVSMNEKINNMFTKQYDDSAMNHMTGGAMFSATSVNTVQHKMAMKMQNKNKCDNQIDLNEKYTGQTGGAVDVLLEEMKNTSNANKYNDVADHNVTDQDGGARGGNKEMLKSMAALNSHIAKKGNIRFSTAMKVSKHYRELAKQTMKDAGIVELNKEATKLVDRDASSGKLASVISKYSSKQERTKGKKKSKGTKRGRSRSRMGRVEAPAKCTKSKLEYITDSE